MAEKPNESQDASKVISLNIMCAICSEFYKPTDTVFSTTCGHLFHFECLFRWITRVEKCPQCSQKCQKQRVHRVFLNFGEFTVEDQNLQQEQEQNETKEEDVSLVPTWYPMWISPEIPASDQLPKGVVQGGTDDEGNPAYVARVYFRNDLLPAAYVPSRKAVLASYACKGYALNNELEILLVKNYKWVKASNGDIPPYAIVGGYSELRESLYIGRAMYENMQLLGKVHRSHKTMYMHYKGKEVNCKEYEVLVTDTVVHNNESSDEENFIIENFHNNEGEGGDDFEGFRAAPAL